MHQKSSNTRIIHDFRMAKKSVLAAMSGKGNGAMQEVWDMENRVYFFCLSPK